MFTGIIEEVGKIKTVTNNELHIYCAKILENANIGDSIAINGVCLSITKIYPKYLCFHVSSTTKKLARFNIGDIKISENINLERALSASARLGGHIVTGHIDCSAKIISINKKGEDTFFEFLYPKELKALIVPKGSIAIDGISLTISDVKSASFIITVIPHTLNSTNLKQKKVGAYVHLEVDVFARYIYHILKTGGKDENDSRIIERFYRW